LKLRAYVVSAVLLVMPPALAQGQAQTARPAEVQKLIDLAKDPERLRQAMSDQRQVQEVLKLMESDAVQQYFRDPTKIAELMTEINPEEIRQVMQAVDPSIIRKAAMARYMERLRQQLGATEEEWKVLEPKVDKLLQAQQEMRAGVRGIGGIGGGGGRQGFFGGNAGQASEVEEAAAALRESARDPDVTARDTVLALKDYRSARNKARQRVADAERELKELLTQRQEAILLMNGLLE
jgi:hypothetical protein